MLSFLVALIFSAGYLVNAYPSGAPKGACATLNPDSHGPSTATGPAPYKVMISGGTYSPSQVLKVSLAGANGALFKGFLIQGRAGQSKDPVGFFQNPSKDSKLLCTDAKDGNGLTHTNNKVKSDITIEWKAPSENKGDVVFHYTVVRGGAPNLTVDPADYFMDVSSEPLKPNLDIYKSLENEEVVEPVETEAGKQKEEEELENTASREEPSENEEVEELTEIAREQTGRHSADEEELEILEIEADEGIKEWVLREEEAMDKALVFQEDEDKNRKDIKVEVME